MNMTSRKIASKIINLDALSKAARWQNCCIRFDGIISSPSQVSAPSSTIGDLVSPRTYTSSCLHSNIPNRAQDSRNSLLFKETKSTTLRPITTSSILQDEHTTGKQEDPDTIHEQEEQAYSEIASAFERLIGEAYQLLAKGQPAEAEYLLLEGAKQAEEILGKDAFELSPLFDQLAIIQFMNDRCEEACTPAQRAYDIVRKFADQEGSPLTMQGAAAASAVRYATALLGSRKPKKALELLETTSDDLDAALQEISSSSVNAATDSNHYENTAEIIEKLEIARGEAQFYMALCSLFTLDDPQKQDADLATSRMEAGLASMIQRLGDKHPLAACALREQGKLIESAVEMGRVDLSMALYRQAILLQERFDPGSVQIVALMYQLGTLQYCVGDGESAVDTLERALAMLESSFEKGEEDHLSIVKHRLGIALASIEGGSLRAKEILSSVESTLIEQFGASNPASLELELVMTGMDLQSEMSDNLLLGKKVGKKERIDALMNDMERAVEGLKKYGEGHMLVHAAEREMRLIKDRVDEYMNVHMHEKKQE